MGSRLRQVKYRNSPYPAGWVNNASVSLTTEQANAITATVTVKDGNQSVNQRVRCRLYLATDATGGTLAAAPDGSVAVGAKGTMLLNTSNLLFDVLTDAAGLVTLTLTESTAKSFFLILVLGDGSLKNLGAVTFV